MPISYADINVILENLLEDETSQRYETPDRITGINQAISRAQTAIGWALANRKGSEEALREMTRIGIWQTNNFGSVLLDTPALGYTIANILAVYPNPALQAPIALTPTPQSLYRPDGVWAGATKPARRVTLEQVPVIVNNSMMAGNEILAANPSRREWAYYLNNNSVYLLPRSQAGDIFVGIAHLEKFAPMTTITSTVNMPAYMTQTLAMWAFSYITWKTGDRGSMGELASKDATELFSFSTQ
jgi:hypothetical protein